MNPSPALSAARVFCRECGGDFPRYYLNSRDVCAECVLFHWQRRRQRLPDEPTEAPAAIVAAPLLPLESAGPLLMPSQREHYRLILAGLSVAAIAMHTGRTARAVQAMTARIHSRLKKRKSVHPLAFKGDGFGKGIEAA